MFEIYEKQEACEKTQWVTGPPGAKRAIKGDEKVAEKLNASVFITKGVGETPSMGLPLSADKDKVLSETAVSKESTLEQTDTLKSSESPAPDGLDARALMGLRKEVAELLAKICHFSLKSPLPRGCCRDSGNDSAQSFALVPGRLAEMEN